MRTAGPLHAVEFQGTGPHKGQEAAARDAVKREALRRAGIGYMEVISGDTPGALRSRVRALVRSAPPVSPPSREPAPKAEFACA